MPPDFDDNHPPINQPLWIAASWATHGTPNFSHPCIEQRVEILKDKDGVNKTARQDNPHPRYPRHTYPCYS